MKGIHIFGIIVGVMVVLTVLVSISGSRTYEWDPTFDAHDDEPFGCELFDQMAASSMGDSYHVESKEMTLNELTKKENLAPTAGKRGWLLQAYELKADSNETHQLLEFVRSGHQVLLATSFLSYEMRDSIHVSIWGHQCVADFVEKKVEEKQYYDTIVWATNDNYPTAKFVIKASLCDTYLQQESCTDDSASHTSRPLYDEEILASMNVCIETDDRQVCRDYPVALSMKMGQGELILVSTPLLLTNYGMLSGQGAPYIFRLLSRFGHRPVSRVVLKTKEQYSYDTKTDLWAMLDYISTQPPLWWAWCLMLLLILLFILTNARRKQRVIPVVTAPENHSLKFVRLIGTLYHNQANHTDLTAKKFHYTAERLRRDLHVDITNPKEDDASATIIAQNTGTDAGEVLRAIKEVRQLVQSRLGISEQEMRHCIELLNWLSSP